MRVMLATLGADYAAKGEGQALSVCVCADKALGAQEESRHSGIACTDPCVHSEHVCTLFRRGGLAASRAKLPSSGRRSHITLTSPCIGPFASACLLRPQASPHGAPSQLAAVHKMKSSVCMLVCVDSSVCVDACARVFGSQPLGQAYMHVHTHYSDTRHTHMHTNVHALCTYMHTHAHTRVHARPLPPGWKDHAPGTLLGYTYTYEAILAIVISAFLGILVSLSTFLVSSCSGPGLDFCRASPGQCD